MDRYTKGFVITALIYFALASVGGIFMGAGIDPSWLRFMHIHFNLLGFMSMMIYGIGYFILPRFNGKDLRFPRLVSLHFYMANLGLLGMVGAFSSRPSFLFNGFAILEGASVGLFVTNLIATLLYDPASVKEKEEGEEEEKKLRPQPILPGMRVGQILEQHPGIHEVFLANGFASLGNPEHREQVKSLPITIMMASQKHGVPLEKLLKELNEFIGVKVEFKGTSPAEDISRGGGKGRGHIGPEDVLGEIIEAHPETEEVFREYYGEGCFSCPGQATESVKMSAMMHNVNMSALLKDLNSAIDR